MVRNYIFKKALYIYIMYFKQLGLVVLRECVNAYVMKICSLSELCCFVTRSLIGNSNFQSNFVF